MPNISDLYDLGIEGNIRGKAAEGFIRPTVKQFFTTVPDYEELAKSYDYNEWDSTKSGNSIHTMTGNYVRFKSTDTAVSLHGRQRGKYYFEIRLNITYPWGPSAIGIGKWPGLDPTGNPLQEGTVTYDTGGRIRVNGTSIENVGSWYTEDHWHTIGVAVDMGNSSIVFSRNGTSYTSVDFSAAGIGTYHTIVGVWNSQYDEKHFYGNWGESAFIYTPPAGYTSFLDLS